MTAELNLLVGMSFGSHTYLVKLLYLKALNFSVILLVKGHTFYLDPKRKHSFTVGGLTEKTTIYTPPKGQGLLQVGVGA